MKNYVLLLLGIFCYVFSFSQTDSCASELFNTASGMEDFDRRVQKWIKDNPPIELPETSYQGFTGGTGCTEAVYVIPVKVHVVHDPNDVYGQGSNISFSQIENQIEALNNAFSSSAGIHSSCEDTRIQFCLKDTSRTSSSAWSKLQPKDNNDFMDAIIGTSRIFDELYLNIYVIDEFVDSIGNPTQVRGYGTYPNSGGREGVVIHHKKFGVYGSSCPSCDLFLDSEGKTLVHEVGHYLGLYHTFKGSCSGLDTTSCSTEGDKCCDTPPVENANRGCMYNNECKEFNDKPDMIENFMDYTSDNCRTCFTYNQTERMYFTLEKIRQKLVDITELNKANLSCCFSIANFSITNSFLCSPDSVYFEAFNFSNSPTYIWKFWEGSTLKDTKITTSHLFTYYMNDTAVYDVELQVVIGSDTTKYKKHNILELKDCGDPLPSIQGNWYFGKFGGLQFRENGIVPDLNPTYRDPDAINSLEGCIAVSNKQGELLFYGGGTDGSSSPMNLFDKNHQYINRQSYLPNQKAGLKGAGTTAQIAISFENYGDSTKYYIFTNSTTDRDSGGIYYSLLDLNLGTAGEIDSTFYNIPLPYVPTLPYLVVFDTFKNQNDTILITSEELSAIAKCDQKSYWLIARSVPNENDSSFIILYTVGSVGPVFHSSHYIPITKQEVISNIAFSPDGNYLAIANYIYRFDKCSGELEEFITIGDTIPPYKIAFSPNSKACYYIEVGDPFDGINKKNIVQLDLSRNDAWEKRTTIGLHNSIGSAQLGPDGKIYFANESKDYLAVINKPNNIVSPSNVGACEFDPDGPSLKNNGIGGISYIGLPNTIDALNEGEFEKGIQVSQWSCDSFRFSPISCCAINYKWYFGDGDSSSLKKPFHTYANNGVYPVTLITELDTLRDTVKIGLDTLKILGNNVLCDTFTEFQFNSSIVSDYYDYTWTSINGSIYVDGSGEFVNVTFSKPGGTLYLHIKDNKTGCVGNDSVQIIIQNPITHNNILGYEDYCDTIDSTFLFINGTPPQGGNGFYRYIWQRSSDNLTWTNLVNDTLEDYTHSGTTNYYYRRGVYSLCQNPSLSNTLLKQYRGYTNTIGGDSLVACNSNSNFKITGNSLLYYYPDTSDFDWQYSYDSITWINDTTTNPVSYEKSLLVDSIFIRRRMRDWLYCRDWKLSNVHKVRRPSIEIKVHPQDVNVCVGTCVPCSISIKNEYNLSLEYDYGNASACGSPSYETNDSLFVLLNNNGGSPFRVRVNNLCGDTIFTDFAYATYDSFGIEFIKHPENQYGTSPTPVFEAIPNSKANGMGWQKTIDRGHTWVTIPLEEDSLLFFGDITPCDSLYFLRAFAYNTCDTVYSDFARLMPNKYDLWIKDVFEDTGAEPRVILKDNFTHSPDMWIRYSQDGLKHSDPWGLDKPNYHFPNTDTSNWVYTTVRNRGTEWTEEADLYLYWTIGSTGETWPRDWVKSTSNRFYNADSNFRFPMGGEINILPIKIDPLAPGDSFNYYFEWTDSIPNPSWYYRYVNGVKTYFQKLGVCFLARIETCDQDPYGMTYPEVASIGENIVNNNNISSHNTILSKLRPPLTSDPGIFVWLPVKDITGTSGNELIDIGLDFNDADFFNYGEIVVLLDDSLESKWIQAGQSGTGFTIINSYTLLVDNPATFTLTGLSFTRNEEVNIGFLFREKVGGLAPTGNTKLYWFEAWQQTQGRTTRDGTVSIFVDAPTSSADGSGGDGGEGDGPVPINGKTKEKVKELKDARDAKVNPIHQEKSTESKVEDTPILESKFTAYPNPFENKLTVEYILLQDVNLEVCLTDVLGRCILDIVPLQEQSKGEYKETVNTENITAGMYYIELKSDGKVFAKKLIRIN